MIKGSKICGIKDPDTLNFIINYPHPPNFIGFICNYPKSSRYVSSNDPCFKGLQRWIKNMKNTQKPISYAHIETVVAFSTITLLVIVYYYPVIKNVNTGSVYLLSQSPLLDAWVKFHLEAFFLA